MLQVQWLRHMVLKHMILRHLARPFAAVQTNARKSRRRHHFSNVPHKVTVCSKCTRGMTFENFVQAFPYAENCYAEDLSIFVIRCRYLEKSCQNPETFPAARSENSQTMEESGHELSYMYICKYTHNCLCVDILLLSVGHRFITQLNICFCCPCY